VVSVDDIADDQERTGNIHFDELVDCLYASLSYSSFFQPFIIELKRSLRLVSVGLVVVEEKPLQALYGWDEGYPPGFVDTLIFTGLLFKDEAIQFALAQEIDEVSCYSDANPDFEIKQMALSSFTRAWTTATGLVDSAYCRLSIGEGVSAIFVMNRHKSCGVFTLAELDMLKRLLGHAGRALRLHHSLNCKKKLSAPISDVIEQSSTPTALFSSIGRLLTYNDAFKLVGASAKIFRVDECDEGVKFDSPELAEQLSQSLTTITLNVRNGLVNELSFLKKASNENDQRSLDDLKFTLVPVINQKNQHDYTIVQVHRVAFERLEISLESIMKLIEVTEAEAKVCQALYSGLDVKAISQQLSISVHTVRSYIKNTLAKNHMTRQAELIAYLARLA